MCVRVVCVCINCNLEFKIPAHLFQLHAFLLTVCVCVRVVCVCVCINCNLEFKIPAHLFLAECISFNRVCVCACCVCVLIVIWNLKFLHTFF